MKSELRGGRFCGLSARDLEDVELLREFRVANTRNREIIERELRRRKRLLISLAKRLIRRYRGLDIDDCESNADILADLIANCHRYSLKH